MKVKFSRSVDYIPEWNGNRELPDSDQVKTKLRPLEMHDLIKLMDNLQSAAVGVPDPASQVASDLPKNMGQIKSLVETCGDLIPKYCDITGLEDGSGPVTSTDLTRFTWYLALAAELLSELGSISMPNEAEEKNLKTQPDSHNLPIQ